MDIQPEQAIITQKVNREETYSVVEWNENKPEIRTSLDDENLGLILATAGLYEIEELIAEIQDEDPLFGEFNFEKELVPKEEKNEVDHAPEVSAIPGVKLVVTLEVSSKKGLLAIPKWKLSEQEEVSVYGSKSEGSLQDADRPALMRFVAEANEKGFSFNKENGTFLLSDWNQIALLTQESLPKWEPVSYTHLRAHET